VCVGGGGGGRFGTAIAAPLGHVLAQILTSGGRELLFRSFEMGADVTAKNVEILAS
jgi:hypothetical protein